jgi:hypothetical protein
MRHTADEFACTRAGILILVAKLISSVPYRRKREERANIRYYKQIHPQLRSFLSPIGSAVDETIKQEIQMFKIFETSNLEFVLRERRCRNATHVGFRASDFGFYNYA